jgi:hypothetical protein
MNGDHALVFPDEFAVNAVLFELIADHEFMIANHSRMIADHDELIGDHGVVFAELCGVFADLCVVFADLCVVFAELSVVFADSSHVFAELDLVNARRPFETSRCRRQKTVDPAFTPGSARITPRTQPAKRAAGSRSCPVARFAGFNGERRSASPA